MKRQTFSHILCLGGLLGMVFLAIRRNPAYGWVSLFAPAAGDNSELQSQTWVRLGGPPGGLGYDIRMNPESPNIMYVTDANAGVFKSIDGGLHWFPINQGIETRAGASGDLIPVFSITLDPHDPETLWIGFLGQRAIYKSTDGGASWALRANGLVDEGLTIRGFAVDPQNSNIVYAAGEVSTGIQGAMFDKTRGVVYRTTDGGTHWSVFWRGDNLARYVWIDPRDSNVIYISTGIFDREAANTDPDANIPGGVGVVKTTDGGQTWEILNEKHGLTGLYIGSLFMHPTNPDILLAAAGHDWWSRHSLTNSTEQISPTGVFRTEDGGETWKMVLKETDGIMMAVEICTSNPEIAYAAGDYNFYRSKDGGVTWQKVNPSSYWWGPEGMIAGLPIDIQCDITNPNRVFVNNYAGSNILSEDGGKHWKVVSEGYSGANIVGGVQIDPDNPALVYAGARSGLFKSEDGGKTWQGLAYPPARFGGLRAFALDPGDPQVILNAPWDLYAPARSIDGGRHWTLADSGLPKELMAQRQLPVTSIRFSPSDSNTIYLVYGPACRLGEECRDANSYLFVSHDGGTTWQPSGDDVLHNSIVHDLVIHPTDPKVLYSATETGVLQSLDGGATWRFINQGLEFPKITAILIDHYSPEFLYVGTGGGGIYRSTNGGKTWSFSSYGLPPEAYVTSIVASPATPSVMFAGTLNSGVFMSEDEGKTWKPINTGLANRSITSLTISKDGQTLYAGTAGGGVFRLSTHNQDFFDQYAAIHPTATEPSLRPSPTILATRSPASTSSAPPTFQSPSPRPTLPPTRGPDAFFPSRVARGTMLLVVVVLLLLTIGWLTKKLRGERKI